MVFVAELPLPFVAVPGFAGAFTFDATSPFGFAAGVLAGAFAGAFTGVGDGAGVCPAPGKPSPSARTNPTRPIFPIPNPTSPNARPTRTVFLL